MSIINTALNGKLKKSKADRTNVLELNQTTEFTPTTDYHPATKKYVDDTSSTSFILKPSITSPVTGATETEIALTITGSVYQTAETFYGAQSGEQVRIATDENFSNVVYQNSTFTISGLAAGTQYFAQIRHISGDISSFWSETVSFTTMVPGINDPEITNPQNNSTNIEKSVVFTSSVYSEYVHSEGHSSSSWQIASDSEFTTIITESLADTINLTSFTATGLENLTQYYVRVKYESISYTSGYSSAIAFTTENSGVNAPIITSPINGATGVVPEAEIVASAYSEFGGLGETHQSTDWQIASDSEFTTIVQESLADTVNLTTWTSSALTEESTFYIRARYNSDTIVSDWSTTISFTTGSVSSEFTVKIDSSLTPDVTDQMAIFFFSTVGDVTINWGDEQSTTVNGIDQNISHNYTVSGLYDVEIIGSGSFKLSVSATSNKYNFSNSYHVLGIENAGAFQFTSGKDIFRQIKTDFYINGDLDLSGVSNMTSIFALCDNFNDDISGWDTTGVTNMNLMFLDAFAFNQDISGWDTSSVTSFYATFQDAEAFNQPIGSWDTSSADQMNLMFKEAQAFNQDISDWNVSNVTNMSSMFESASSFNQSLSDWNTSSVTNMAKMFSAATAFNADLSGWDTSSVTDMSQMFYNCYVFDSNISGWDTSSVTTMRFMLHGTAINQPIGSWDVSSVTTMDYMFKSVTEFNQNLSAWDVSSVTGMADMFRSATSFNQNISGWNVGAVTGCSGFRTSSGLDCINTPALPTACTAC